MIIKRFMKESEIEDAACNLIQLYSREIGGLVEPPVDVDLIAESVCKLTFVWEFMPELLDRRPDLADVLSDEEKKKSIVLGGLRPRAREVLLNEKHIESYKKQPGRERFTKAHELGHWQMHIDKSVLDQTSLFGSDDESEEEHTIICMHKDDSRLEWQANYFAGALLMPKDLLMEEAVPHSLGSWDLQYALATHFNVTISALVIRMKQIGLTYVDDEGRIHRSAAEAHGQIRLK